ncbi:MAG: PD-(D/E)XK nuclease domain-containing protein, partial [Myxococcota bacterium]
REAGEGRADVMLIPRKPDRPGIILEFKRAPSKADQERLQQTAQAALRQIKDKNYLAEFSDSQCSFVLAVGVAFAGKSLAAAHEQIA